jgi:hypothetical protein
MGAYGGPDIITDGLVFAVDAGSERSYPGSGTTVTDLVGTNNGALVNGVGYNSANGGSFTFDGTDDYINLSTLSNSMNSSEFTIGTVIKIDSFASSSSSRPYISNWNSWSPGSQKGFLLRTFMTSNKSSFWWCDGTNYTSLTSTTEMSLGEYYYVCVTYSSSGVKIYVNGVLEGTSSSLLGGVVFESNTRIGYTSINTGFFDGNIANARIYNRALTAEEVLQNYNAQKSRFI